MFEATFEHYGEWFGIVADDWGDDQGVKIAAAVLEQKVRDLSGPAVKVLHSALAESDTAFADDPIFDSPVLSSLCTSIQAARRAGFDVSDERLNEGHHCNCQLVPLPKQL